MASTTRAALKGLSTPCYRLPSSLRSFYSSIASPSACLPVDASTDCRDSSSTRSPHFSGAAVTDDGTSEFPKSNFPQAFHLQQLQKQKLPTFAARHLLATFPDGSDVKLSSPMLRKAQQNVVEEDSGIHVLRLAREAQILALLNPAGWPADPLTVVEDGTFVLQCV